MATAAATTKGLAWNVGFRRRFGGPFGATGFGATGFDATDVARRAIIRSSREFLAFHGESCRPPLASLGVCAGCNGACMGVLATGDFATGPDSAVRRSDCSTSMV